MLASTEKVAAFEFGGDAGKEGLGEAADKGRAAGEGEAVAVDHPDDADDADGVEDMHQHRQHVLGAHEAAIEQGEAGDRHQQHENGRGHHPGVVALVDGRLRECRCGRERDRRGKGGGQPGPVRKLERHSFAPVRKFGAG